MDGFVREISERLVPQPSPGGFPAFECQDNIQTNKMVTSAQQALKGLVIINEQLKQKPVPQPPNPSK